MSKLFRPYQVNKKWTIRERRQGSSWSRAMHFREYTPYIPAGWTKHQLQFAKRFMHLHYLACHAPAATRAKWSKAYKLLMNKCFASGGKASVRNLNSYTCYRWL